MLKVLGVGLPRTGTSSLAEALRILGYSTAHHAPERVPLYPQPGETWRRWDDLDAVTDAPAAMYWREILQAYPSCKAILTVRDTDSWWASIKRHAYTIRQSGNTEHIVYTDQLHGLLFGTPHPQLYWYARRFHEHEQSVLTTVPYDRLLVMDIHAGDKWDVLCRFLGVPEPDVAFPWRNKAS
jgi:hypothetical protein